MSIGIVDTSVFCNILDVPFRNQARDRALDEFETLIQSGTTLLLPLAVVYETGNHIAHCGDGTKRRQAAVRFVDAVRDAYTGAAPWTTTPVQSIEDMMRWLETFPDFAMREVGIGDLSVVRVFEDQCAIHRSRRVFIWSYDQHLGAYDRLGD